ncbi:MAG: hypothetical protein F4121_12650 [Acidimicrobiia bacterium]|nr:hypothetical protein [Acidimicrobiia bacterium]MYC44022.1 hypothetical protein [Acidimicrobiia bacterium]MYI20880.1 hypothetical protein [Acidimicrobiia bacterium]
MTVEGRAEYSPRLLDGKLREVLAFSPAVVVEGPRGCGKTTTGSRAASSFLAMDEVDVAGGSPGALGP